MNGFKLAHKNYQNESYVKEVTWKGKKIELCVSLQYHTFLKFWHASYKIGYGKGFITPQLEYHRAEDNEGRKELRMLAQKWMKSASANDADKLDDFYQKNILEG